MNFKLQKPFKKIHCGNLQKLLKKPHYPSPFDFSICAFEIYVCFHPTHQLRVTGHFQHHNIIFINIQFLLFHLGKYLM